MTFTYFTIPSSGKVEIIEVNEKSCKGTMTMFGSKPEQVVLPKVGTVLTYPEPDPWKELEKKQDGGKR